MTIKKILMLLLFFEHPLNEIALKCREPSPAYMQTSTCVLEGCITLVKMAENSLTF